MCIWSPARTRTKNSTRVVNLPQRQSAEALTIRATKAADCGSSPAGEGPTLGTLVAPRGLNCSTIGLRNAVQLAIVAATRQIVANVRIVPMLKCGQNRDMPNVVSFGDSFPSGEGSSPRGGIDSVGGRGASTTVATSLGVSAGCS